MTGKKPWRLFIAMPLGDQIEQTLAHIIRDLKQSAAAVRWVAPKNIHLTLRFLGDTDPDRVGAIKQLLDESARSHTTIDTRVDLLSAFPNLKRPRIFWVGSSDREVTERLCELALHVERGVQELGYEPSNKSFKPHLTLGRVKRPDNLDRLVATVGQYELPVLNLHLDRMVLFRSTLTSEGPIYDRLHESQLSAERFE